MLKKIAYIVLFLSIAPYLLATQVGKISVRGAKAFDKNDYIDWSGLKIGMKYYPALSDSVIKRISVSLADRGYIHSSADCSAEILSSDTSRLQVNMTVKENDPSYIKNIFIGSGNVRDSAEIYPEFDYLTGRIFNMYEIEESIERTIDRAENSGSPFMTIRIKSVNFYYDSTDKKDYTELYLAVEKGKMSLIEIIEIKGNENTKDFVITRESRVQPGEVYSQTKLEDIPKRLNRLKFFEPVQVPEYYFNSKNNGILSITIKEKQTNNFDGIIGYIPAEGNNDNGYLTGLVNISLRNLFGTGRAAAFRWQQYDRNSQELEIKYLEPWFFGFPFNINAGLFQRKQDTSYVQRRVDGSLEYLANESLTLSLTMSSESVIPTESENSVFTVYNSSSITTGFSLKADTRDDIYSPTEGLYFLSGYGYRKKTINGPAKYLTASAETKFDMQRLTFDFGIYRQFFNRQIAALSVHGRELRGSSFETSDLFQLGGTNTLRGYKENQFSGNRLLWGNLEYRFLMSRRTYFFTFLDMGYYLRNGEPEKKIEEMSSVKTGYGLGLNLETSLGVLSVSFALAKGDSFGQGKIHFGLVNEF